MTGQLKHVGDDGPVLCSLCGDRAAGPCARCKKPVCGDCCVLVEGAKVWAICLTCEKRGGRSLRPGWLIVMGWIALPIIGLVIALAVLAALFPHAWGR